MYLRCSFFANEKHAIFPTDEMFCAKSVAGEKLSHIDFE